MSYGIIHCCGSIQYGVAVPELQISHIDHLVLTVRNLKATCQFYSQVLGMTVVTFGEGRTALQFGHQKINLHLAGAELAPHASCPLPGSADLCLMLAPPLATPLAGTKVTDPLQHAIAHLQALNVPVLMGPVRRTGAIGPIESIYLRDPDGNLIELARPLTWQGESGAGD